MEQLFTKPLENALGSVEGLHIMSSSSQEGSASVFLEFTLDTDIHYAEINVREKVEEAEANFPSFYTGLPSIYRYSTDDTPIMWLALYGNKPEGDLNDIFNNIIAPQIEGLPGVGTVNIYGSRTKQFDIVIDRSLLSACGFSIGDITNAVINQNVSIPAGNMNGKNMVYTLNINGLISKLQDLKNIYLRSSNGKIFRLGDIAHVEENFPDETSDPG